MSGDSPPVGLVSIHDVAPEVLSRVQQLLDLFPKRESPVRAELLVIPGLDWAPTQIDQLRRWADEGHLLAGHGWIHRATERRDAWHHMHAAILSRNVAEHLSRSTLELQELVQRCFEWFARQQLPEPQLYVPPAWALGKLPGDALRELPFRWYEHLSGYFDARRGASVRVPLLGFEADTRLRAFFLRGFNGLNRKLAAWRGQPVRISLHPFDLDYRLGGEIEQIFRAERWQFELATEWLAADGSAAEPGGNGPPVRH